MHYSNVIPYEMESRSMKLPPLECKKVKVGYSIGKKAFPYILFGFSTSTGSALGICSLLCLALVKRSCKPFSTA